MVCFGGPSAGIAAVITFILWRAQAVIETAVRWLFVVLGWIAVAAVGAIAAVILSAAVATVLYIGHRIQRRQQARGACLKCQHPCIGELGGQDQAPAPAQQARTALPAVQPGPMPRGLAVTGARTLDGRVIRRTGGK